MSGASDYWAMRLSLDEVIALDIWAQAANQHGGSWLALAERNAQLVGVRQRFSGALTVVLPAAALAEGRALFDAGLDYYPAQVQPHLFALTDPAWRTRPYDGVLAQIAAATLIALLDELPMRKDAPLYLVVRTGPRMMWRGQVNYLIARLAASGYQVTWKAGLHTTHSLLCGGWGKLAERAGFERERDRAHFRMRRGFVTPGLPRYARTYLLVAEHKERLS